MKDWSRTSLFYMVNWEQTFLRKGGTAVDPVDLGQLLSDQQDRRIRVIENLLRGKKTVSTLYWGQRYQLLPLLNLAKHLTREELDVAVAAVVHNGWATVDDDQKTLRLTAVGVSQLAAVPYYRPVTVTQWPNLDLAAARQRLLLAIQVTSQYAHSTSRYYPLATNQPTRQAVRQWFHRTKSPQLAAAMRDALTQSLQQLPQQTAEVVVDQLTGVDQPGLTLTQLATQTKETVWEIRLRQLDGVTQIASDARQPRHPLHDLLAPMWRLPVARSAQETLAAVESSGDLQRIADQRQVKLSTVREHLLEAAIMLPLADFPYEVVLPATIRTAFSAVLTGDVDTWQYTALPESLQAQYDFFYFRLYAIWCIKREAV